MASVFDVSNYILQLSNSIDSDERDLISNLKLQKLLYYCYGFSLVLLKKKLFNDDKIKAWPLGPVCPKVYNKYKKYESNKKQTINGTGKIVEKIYIENEIKIKKQNMKK